MGTLHALLQSGLRSRPQGQSDALCVLIRIAEALERIAEATEARIEDEPDADNGDTLSARRGQIR